MIYIQSQQVVLPKSIYIGDKAELHCSFKSGGGLFADSVSISNFSTELDFTQYEIKNVSLAETGTDYYTITVEFVPWRVGEIQFPDFEIEGLGVLHFEPVSVASLVAQQGVSSLKGLESPLLLPGTTYKIYGGIAAFVIFLYFLIRLIVKRQKVIFWFKNKKLKRKYLKNKKSAVKNLKLLLENNARGQTPAEIATSVQKIMRNYLEVRLDYPFTKKLTSELSMAFYDATCGMAGEKRENAFENIISSFVRTDYIRFSSAKTAVFETDELENLVNSLIEDILAIEEVEDA